MAGRIGDVLYWLGNGIACLVVIGAYVMAQHNGGYQAERDFWPLAGMVAIFGGIPWLIGRGCKYILKGE